MSDEREILKLCAELIHLRENTNFTFTNQIRYGKRRTEDDWEQNLVLEATDDNIKAFVDKESMLIDRILYKAKSLRKHFAWSAEHARETYKKTHWRVLTRVKNKTKCILTVERLSDGVTGNVESRNSAIMVGDIIDLSCSDVKPLKKAMVKSKN